MFWNVRVIPRLVIACGGNPLIRSPSNTTSPAVGGKTAVTTLKSVVFPAPFGPMTPTISPGPDVEGNPGEGRKPPERFPDVPQGQEAAHAGVPFPDRRNRRSSAGSITPCGRKTIISTSRIP